MMSDVGGFGRAAGAATSTHNKLVRGLVLFLRRVCSRLFLFYRRVCSRLPSEEDLDAIQHPIECLVN